MPIEETTFSEEHLTSPSWKEWAQENKIFLATIGGLMTLSLVLLFQNTPPKYKDIPKPQLQPVVQLKKPPKVIHKILPPRGPLEIAQHLYQESKTEEAIRLLLHTAQTHPEEPMREEASRLAKEYHAIQAQKTQIQKFYLQGYVLFHTYPKEACQQWAKALMIPLKEDAYTQKAQKRWSSDCKNY
ncbi:MAG: hypothetical protein HYY61_05695 [Deltaproteobacteria bacterium]|nr:hypothetical protein [Deltaproteobacteria bacterium]